MRPQGRFRAAFRGLEWLLARARSGEGFGVCDLVFSGFLRVVTSPRIFDPPTPLDTALKFIEEIRALPNYVAVNPGSRHWDLFKRLCRQSNARANLAPNAYYAAIALESGSEWITTDRGLARFPGLRWRTLESG